MDLKEYYFFSSLDNEDLDKLNSISNLKKFSKGETLFYEGENSKYLYFLIKGFVKLYKHDYKEKQVVIHNINAPSLIAEIANYEEIPYPLNCSFEIDSEVLQIDYKKFKEEFLYKKEFSIIFIKSLSKKIKYLENFIHTNVKVDINAKVARFLYENEKVLNSIKQIKMAEMLNIREETLSRKIARLIKNGIIEKDKRNIKIIDHQRLLNEFI